SRRRQPRSSRPTKTKGCSKTRRSPPAKPGPKTFNSSGAIAPQLVRNMSVGCWLMGENLGKEKAQGGVDKQVSTSSLASRTRSLLSGEGSNDILNLGYSG